VLNDYDVARAHEAAARLAREREAKEALIRQTQFAFGSARRLDHAGDRGPLEAAFAALRLAQRAAGDAAQDIRAAEAAAREKFRSARSAAEAAGLAIIRAGG
jgi:hypothetical protein